MAYLNPPENGIKPPSRFSSLKVFKLKSGSASSPLDAAPPPPPKDSMYATSPSLSLNLHPPAFYNKSIFSRSAASLVPSLSPESISGPATPSTPYHLAPSIGFDFGKRSNVALASINGRAAAGSPAPSASGGSFKSLGRGAGDFASSSMDGSTDSSGSCPNAIANLDMYLLNGASSSSYTMGQASTSVKPKKSVFKLANLAKRNRSKKDLSDATSTPGSVGGSTSVSEQYNTEGDEGISLPWNFQHNIHVDEAYIGLPPSWTSALSQVGFDEDEIAAIHARRRAAATISNTNPTKPPSAESPTSPHGSTTSPPTIFTSSSNILLEPVPRSTSLGKGRDALMIHPPSIYSLASSTGGSTIGCTSPVPSPRAPSFSMKSFVSGIKNSLSSDSASMREGVAGSSGREDAMGGESEQYVFVEGDGPAEGGDRGMGDETLIEPYPFDTLSISSHQTHSSSIQQMSQGGQSQRIPTFPQIQVQRAQSETGHVPVPSLAFRAPSPLAHSTSLPTSNSPHGYTYSNQPASPSTSHSLASTGLRQGSVSGPPRTPPRRIYHIANASSDSYDGTNYTEPPPAYVSPKKGEWIPKREKEGFGVSGGPPPPHRPIPPVPTEDSVGEPSSLRSRNSREENREASISDTTDSSTDNIPGTADDILDIASYYGDNSAFGGDAEADPARQAVSPTLPLVIDKRMIKLATLPPRLSFHHEGNLEDWSESLFSAISSKEKRSSIVMGPGGGNTASAKKERRTTLRPMPPLSVIGKSGSATAANSSPSETVASTLSDTSGANLTLGPHAKGTMDAVEEGDEQQQVEESAPKEDTEEQAAVVDETETVGEVVKEEDDLPVAPSTPVLPDVSLGPDTSPLGKDLEPPLLTPRPSESPPRTRVDSLPPSPPPKSKPKPAPLAIPAAVTLAPPRTSIIPGISGKSPVNSLFGAKPQPLPIPIPPSQIRAQLRPAPPKSPHSPPTLPLPPLKRLPSQVNLQPLPPHQLQLPLPPSPSPLKASRHVFTEPHALPGDSRPNSSQVFPVRANGDRDSGLSTITVTPATIATAKTEVVRTAIASVVESDAVSLASKRESASSTADTETQTLAYDEPDMGIESPRTQERKEAPGDSMISGTSSVSLLRDGPQSKWPTPPPPPVELEADSTPRRVSRFRTTSLGRVTQLQAMATSPVASPIDSHCSHGSSDTTSSSTSESAPLTTPKGVNGVSPSAVSRSKGNLAAEARLLSSTTDTFGGVEVESEDEEGEARSVKTPTSESPASISSSEHPLLVQLQPYISPLSPASCFTNLVEIAEGESGSVFAARVAPLSAYANQQNSTERPISPGTSHVAIKRIPLPPITSSPSLSDDSPISNKLVSVLHELCVLKDLDHEHLLLLDAVYVGSSAADAESTSAVDTSLWIRMELMERSLADVIGLVAEGLALQERLIARFASDILHGLDYLQKQHIAHRDVRSDNLLVNASGVVKLADFSNAICVDRNAPIVSGAVGVVYWQAPEMRAGPYDALKVDIWSLGATVWELAETVPPFSTPASPSMQVSFTVQTTRRIGSQWPPLTHPEHYSRPFHEFLKLCGRESGGRPCAGELLNTSFVRNACGRAVILQLLAQCRAIEETIAAKEASVSQS